MMPIALARKYRPKRFADLLVQDHVGAALCGAVASQRVGHGYLFAGPRGVGKTTAARILAMALNCERRSAEGDPCGECESCLRIWSGATGLDVVEIDAASNRGVDDARDLRERARYAASAPGRSKVYIVDEAHMLTREAWNALLKILEEPPPGVVFVFATTEPQKIAQSAAPVLSRLQRFDFRRVGPDAIERRLAEVAKAEGLEVEPEAMVVIARRADGGMRDALSILDQVLSFGEGRVTVERVRETLGLIADDVYGELLRIFAERDAGAVFPLVERLSDAGADLGEFVAGAGDLLRALLQAQLGGAPHGLSESLKQVVAAHRDSDALRPGDALRLLQLIADSEVQVRRGGNGRLLVEVLLLKGALMGRAVELQAVLEALGAGAGSREPLPPPNPGPLLRDAAPASPSTAPPAPGSRLPAPEKGDFTVERLRALWPRIVAEAEGRSRMLGQALRAADVAGVAPPVLRVALREASPVYQEGITRQRATVEQVVEGYVEGKVRLEIVSAPPAPAPATTRGPNGGARRLTEEDARAERLRALEARDPGLKSAVEALDLELLE
jgi:DNA polymerase III subunit gamma/tau